MLASLFALLCAYVTAFVVAPTWTTLGLFAVVAASVAGLVSRRPGAGGRARGSLRGLATFFSSVARRRRPPPRLRIADVDAGGEAAFVVGPVARRSSSRGLLGIRVRRRRRRLVLRPRRGDGRRPLPRHRRRPPGALRRRPPRRRAGPLRRLSPPGLRAIHRSGRRLLFALLFGSFLATFGRSSCSPSRSRATRRVAVTALGTLAARGVRDGGRGDGALRLARGHARSSRRRRATRPAKRRRLVALGTLVAAAGVTVLGVSPGARCLVGSASSCAAASRIESDDPVAHLRYARRGCARGDAAACAEAGALLLRGTGAATDPRSRAPAPSFLHPRRRVVRQREALRARRGLRLAERASPDSSSRTSSGARPRAAPTRTRARELKIKACRLGLDEACAP